MSQYTPRDTNDIPYGYCQCGCGQKTNLAPQTDRQKGWIRGEPMRYVAGHARKGQFIERDLWSNVDVGDPDSCWDWKGKINGSGYGYIVTGGRAQFVHRLAWELANNQEIPKGMVILHLCDRPRCTNPAHLRLGTYSDNMQDCKAKGRYRHIASPGESNGSAKLTEQDVIKIRRLYADGFGYKPIARRYNVTARTITLIVKRITWRHVG